MYEQDYSFGDNIGKRGGGNYNTCHTKLVLPQKMRKGFFDDLYVLGFLPMFVKCLFAVMILAFSLTALEIAVYGFKFPSKHITDDCCGIPKSSKKGFSCFFTGACDDKPRPYNGCVGCLHSLDRINSQKKARASWLVKVFTGC